MAPSSDDEEDRHARELYSIPKSSSWFQWDDIHETERRSLPEFFDGTSPSRNPRVYKEYRDFIINKYREDPSRRLTFTEVRKSLIGDAGYIYKVFSFLDRCGLINFGAAPLSVERTAEMGPEDGQVKVVVEEGVPEGVEVVPAVVLRRKRTAVVAAMDGISGASGFKVPPLTSYTDVFGDLGSKRGGICSLCGKQGGSSSEPQILKSGLPVCSGCSKEKGWTESKAENDSIKEADDAANHATSAWTDAETLLLLEAVLKHGDDWDFIAQHVQTKSKIECIAKLIHLPFGEHLLGTLNGKFDSKMLISRETEVKKETNEPQEEPEKINGHGTDDSMKVEEEPISGPPLKKRSISTFGDAAGSLMKQVASLSKVAGPDVASAAAESAIMALCNENPCARRAFDIDDNEESKLKSMTNKCSSKSKDEDLANKKEKDSPDVTEDKNYGIRAFQLRAAIATGLGAAAARAKLLADQEEREMEFLMASIIEAQIRKLQSKVKHFEELQLIMEKEYILMQKTKETILEEWAAALEEAFQAGLPKWKDYGPPKSFLNTNM